MIEKKINYDRMLTFLEHRGSSVPENLKEMIQQVSDEICESAAIKTCHLETEDFIACNDKKCVLFAVTLGNLVEQKILYYEKTYITRAIMADAAANVLMEYVIDQFQRQICKEYHDKALYISELNCPGNQDIPISWNQKIVRILDASKRIGVHATEHFHLLPQKSVAGFFLIDSIPFDEENEKCKNCLMDCRYRKRSAE